MKKLLLSIGLLCSAAIANAQIIFDVLEPANIAGGMDIGFTATDWGFPDMNDPLNSVTDTLMMVNDGAVVDSLACTTLANDLTGKIAVLYRGDCQFGDKALNAQNAGAVGVIIINNVSPGYINPGAGLQGGNVTIPVVMVSAADGAALRAELDAGTPVVAYLGTQLLHYANDLRFKNGSAQIPNQASTIAANAQDDTEFSVDLSAWVYNSGSADQTGVTATAKIESGGSVIYTNTSTAFDLLSKDSALISFPTFSQTTYPVGDYTLTYSFTMANADEYTLDDSLVYNFRIDEDRFAVAELDASGQAVNSSGIRPANSAEPFTACIVYSDPNASRKSARKVGFSASKDTTGGVSIDGELIEINIYQWNDVFVDMDDAGFNVSDYEQVGFAEYYYTSDIPNVTVYQELEESFNLIDNQRYLVCVTTYDVAESVFIGFDDQVNYTLNESVDRQPRMMMQANGTWSLGFATPTYPAIVLETGDPVFAGVEENTVEVTPFPNPARDIINIPLSGVEGAGELFISDLSGKVVSTQNVSVNNGSKLVVDVSELPSGIYVFSMNFDNGESSTFNVVVTK